MYFWNRPPVFHLYLACISPYPWYPAVFLYLAILQQIHCIPLYPTVSSCICTYLAVSSCICCISPYPTASKTGYNQKYTPGEGYPASCLNHPPTPYLGLYKISFTSRLICTNQSSFIAPPRPHCPHYCSPIARLLRNIRPRTDPPFVCHTPYNIGHGNIVQRPTPRSRGELIHPPNYSLMYPA